MRCSATGLPRTRLSSFNEAEARVPRMLDGGPAPGGRLHGASMRPRRECLGCGGEEYRKSLRTGSASMRPRRECLGCHLGNRVQQHLKEIGFNEAEARVPRMQHEGGEPDLTEGSASMRPRRECLGCEYSLFLVFRKTAASMRPRRECLGCHKIRRSRVATEALASMRPRRECLGCRRLTLRYTPSMRLQ